MLTGRMAGPGEQRSDRTGGLLDRGSMFPGVYSSSGFDMLKILVRETSPISFIFFFFFLFFFPPFDSLALNPDRGRPRALSVPPRTSGGAAHAHAVVP